MLGNSVAGRTVDEVVAEVRGPAGTEVTLGLLRDGEIIETTITRAAVVVPVVTSELLEPGIGYVALSSFTNNSAGQVHDTLESLLAEGAVETDVEPEVDPVAADEIQIHPLALERVALVQSHEDVERQLWTSVLIGLLAATLASIGLVWLIVRPLRALARRSVISSTVNPRYSAGRVYCGYSSTPSLNDSSSTDVSPPRAPGSSRTIASIRTPRMPGPKHMLTIWVGWALTFQTASRLMNVMFVLPQGLIMRRPLRSPESALGTAENPCT